MATSKKLKNNMRTLSGYLYFFIYILAALAVINLAFAAPLTQEMQAAQEMQATQESDLAQEFLTRISSTSGKMLKSNKLENEILAKEQTETPAKQPSAKKNVNTATNKARSVSAGLTNVNNDFAIYEARHELTLDIDEDGYYREFTLVFDADVQVGVAQVYADIYLSQNGGPWLHHFTTDVFTIVGDSSEDEYEITSSLVEGFPTNEYDVLIDLYEYGYSDVVATDSADNNAALYALPLEDAGYDTVIVVHEDSHGGSVSWLLLLSCGILLMLRKGVKNTRVSA